MVRISSELRQLYRAIEPAALDSTSLMPSKDLSTIARSPISTKAVSYFTALYINKDAQSISISATDTLGSGGTGNTASGSMAPV